MDGIQIIYINFKFNLITIIYQSLGKNINSIVLSI